MELLPSSLKGVIYNQPPTGSIRGSFPIMSDTNQATGVSGIDFTLTQFGNGHTQDDLEACTTFITVTNTNMSAATNATTTPTTMHYSSSEVAVPQLTMWQVLQISTDIAAGLR
jgi:hypothetical protein